MTELQLETGIEIGIFAFTLFAVMIQITELIRFALRGRFKSPFVREMLASYSTMIPLIAVDVATAALLVGGFSLVGAHSIFEIATTPLSVLAAILLVDFTYYWEHRIQHRTPLFWALAHTVHHSSPQFNQSVAFRLSYADIFISPWFYLPLVVLGFHPLLVLGIYALNLTYQTWIHTELIGRLPGFDRWFNSPSNHRVHHGSEPAYHDKNFGGILMCWDVLFGTYEPEAATPTYGIQDPLNSSNPMVILFRDAGRLFRKVRAERSWTRRFALLFSPDPSPISQTGFLGARERGNHERRKPKHA